MDIKDVVCDPEFESFLPPLSSEERSALKADIEANGITDSIIVWQHHGEIIDGYNRYRIWLELGADRDKAPDIIERKFPDRAAVMEWMFHHQISRRNWTAAQKAATALKMKPAIEQKAAESKSNNAKTTGRGKKVSTNSSKTKVDTRKEVAKIAGVSQDTVRKTEAVLEHGSPEVREKMLAGEMSANEAFKEIKQPKNGSVIAPAYDEKKIDKPIGVIRRELDERVKAFPTTEKLFRAAKYALSAFNDAMTAWRGAK